MAIPLWKQYAQLPRAVHVLCLGTLINRAGTFLVVFLTLYLKEQLELGIEFATGCMGAFGLGSMAAGLVGGHLADAIGRRVIMLVALFGGAAILLVFSVLTAPWAIMLATVVFAFVAEMYRPAASAMIADLVEPDRRPQAFGLMYVAINLGFSVAPIVGGLLIEHLTFKWLFWGDAVTAACYGVIVLLFIRETLPGRRPQPASPAEANAAAETLGWRRAAAAVFSDTTFLVFCLATFFIAMVFMQSMSTFPLYLSQRGIDAPTYGRIIAVNGIMIAIFQLPFTALISRFNRATMICLAAVFNAIGFGLIGVVDGVWWFVGTVVVWTAGEMMAAPVAPTIVSDLAPTHLRARYMGVFTMSFSGANMIGAPLGGMVLARCGGAYVWACAFALALVAALLYLTIHRRIGPPRPTEQKL